MKKQQITIEIVGDESKFSTVGLTHIEIIGLLTIYKNKMEAHALKVQENL